MTIRQKMAKKLDGHGLFPQEIEGVLDHYENSSWGEDMKGRMNDDVSDYPEQLLSVVWVGIRKAAVEWIDEHKPQHWARPLFAN